MWQKYGSTKCWYAIRRFFKEQTIIAQMLEDNISPETKSDMITHRNETLAKVKAFIDVYLDPSKSTYTTGKTISDILNLLLS